MSFHTFQKLSIMSQFIKILLMCLLSISIVRSSTDCNRKDGDEVIFSQPLFNIGFIGESSTQKTFEGYRITCVETNFPFGLEVPSIFNVLKGGVGCDSINFKFGKLFFFGVGVKIYGIKLEPGETNDSTCSK